MAAFVSNWGDLLVLLLSNLFQENCDKTDPSQPQAAAPERARVCAPAGAAFRVVRVLLLRLAPVSFVARHRGRGGRNPSGVCVTSLPWSLPRPGPLHGDAARWLLASGFWSGSVFLMACGFASEAGTENLLWQTSVYTSRGFFVPVPVTYVPTQKSRQNVLAAVTVKRVCVRGRLRGTPVSLRGLSSSLLPPVSPLVQDAALFSNWVANCCLLRPPGT